MGKKVRCWFTSKSSVKLAALLSPYMRGSSLELGPQHSAGIRPDHARPDHVGSSLYTNAWGNNITVGEVEKAMAGTLSSAIRSSNP